MKEFEICLNIRNKVTEQDVDDMLTTAFEGGINYWCGNIKCTTYPEGERDDLFCSEVVSKGGVLQLEDAEDSKEKWELNLDKVLKGFQLHCNKKEIDVKQLMDNYDADDADCIVQYALFGELVFC